MAKLESLGEVITTDVLVVGGGIAGLAAAITVKEKAPSLDVLIVEKATTGWAGKAPKGVGIVTFLSPNDSVEAFVECHVREIGCYLEDQELLAEYARTCNEVLECLESWGATTFREDGTWRYTKMPGGYPWGLTAVELDMCGHMRKFAKKLGTRFVDMVSVVDLLRDGDRVAGAIGFSVDDGACHIIRAGATILANGNQNYRVMPMWSCGRGDGIAAAYRAGARMRNAEFGSFINMMRLSSKEVVNGAENVMYNAAGESVTRKYRAQPQPDIDIKSQVGWYREHQAGKGPVYENRDEDTVSWGEIVFTDTSLIWDRPVTTAFWTRLREKANAAPGSGPAMQEIAPGFVGEESPVKVDHRMATTVPGLFAVGDICYNGSAWTGAVPAPPGRVRGTGLSYAVWSARRGASAATDYLAGLAAAPAVDDDQAKALKDRIFVPLNRDKGRAAIDLVYAVQEAVAPFRYSNYKSAERMTEALGKVTDIQAELPELKAKDPHDLARCNEAASMAVCAEMFYRASLERKESRGWFVRQDYPATDNENWLKWIVLEYSEGQMSVSTEDIPIERYPIRP